MKGLLAINAYFDGEEYLYQPKRMKEEFEKRGVECDIKRNDDFSCRIENGDIVFPNEYDFCVYWDKDKYILSMLEKSGIRVFNSYSAIAACDDKMTTYVRLANTGLPLVDTLAGLLCYSPSYAVTNALNKVEETFGYPLIAKCSYGSLGQGVFLINSRDELFSKYEELKCVPHPFQKFIASSYGRDVRVIVVGGEVLGGMERRSSGDFRSNIGSGGKGEKFDLNEVYVDLAKRVSETLGLDYCGIDFLFGEDGPLICEVNSNAYFCAFEKITGVNVAAKYVEYVLSSLEKR